MTPPFALSVEGAGRILALGEGVDHLREGQRVAWFYVRGSYAEQIIVTADALLPLPDSINDETAASLMMQGLTASHFALETYAVKPPGVFAAGDCRKGTPKRVAFAIGDGAAAVTSVHNFFGPIRGDETMEEWRV